MRTYRANAGGIHFAAAPVWNISNRRIPIEEEAVMGEIATGGEHAFMNTSKQTRTDTFRYRETALLTTESPQIE